MKLLRIFGITAACAVIGTAASAQVLSCSGLQNFVMPSIGSNFDIHLTAGDQVTVTAGSGGSAYSVEVGSTVLQCGFVYGGASCAGHVFTAPTTGTYTFEKTGGQIADTVNCAAGGGGSGSGSGSGTGGSTGTGGTATTTSAQARTQAAQGSGAVIAGSAASGFIGSAIGQANGNNTYQGTVTQNGLFLSTSGGPSQAMAWAALQARGYNGDVDGRSYELTLGAEFEPVASTRLGLVLSAGRTDLDVDGTDVGVRALSFGPYFTSEFGQRYKITGYALFSSPRYDVDGTKYTAQRSTGALRVSADYALGDTDLTSYVSLSGFTERHPSQGVLSSRTITQMTGSLGVRATFNAGGDLKPYLLLGADFSRFDNGDTDSEFAAPRLGAGFEWASGASTLRLDIDGGKVLEDTRDVGLQLGYSFDF